ncbi:MAG: hypothetical protein APF84_18020 [Gracilibacter sp. BRH_c7a]|nr:MAG: hypothetical protein APF84_18020 [Gracilibacter sp. BRH_c7a]
MQKIDLKKLRLSLDSLTIYDDILNDNIVKTFKELLDTLSSPEVDCERIYREYFKFYKAMIGFNWKEHLIDLIIRSENKLAFTNLLEDKTGLKQRLIDNVQRDLATIEQLSAVQAQDIIDLISASIFSEISSEQQTIFETDLSPSQWPVWENSLSASETDIDTKHSAEKISAVQWLKQKRASLIEEFEHKNWKANVQSLMEYHSEVGYGIYGDYVAFRVSESGNELEGIKDPDPIEIKNLICQEREQSIVIQNTEYFINGFRANNIILYGNRGTGKSSLVKALLNEYASRRLRLVQLNKNQIDLFPKLVGQLSQIPLKFIIFIDDLSFDAAEEDYKSLKSLLEGGIEVKPDNVLVYATSNRKHLVTESFADRKSNDVHAQDNMEEKLSLADRFGITVTFLSPDQETYLRIAEGLAEQNGIKMDEEELRERAKKWTMMHNSRSGRTARQFIDYLKGELAITGEK